MTSRRVRLVRSRRAGGSELWIRSSETRAVAFLVPATLTYRLVGEHDLEITVDLEAVPPDGQLKITRMELVGTVTSTALRAIPDMLDVAAREVAQVAVVDGEAMRRNILKSGGAADAEVTAAIRRERGPTGSRVSEGELRRVARAAKAAPAGGLVQAVMDLHYTKPTAQRLLRAARACGLLPHSARSASASRTRRR